LVPRFPIEYRKVQILTVLYRTDESAIRANLPTVLEPCSDLVMVHLYRMPEVQGMGRVTECNVMVAAQVRDDPSLFGGFTTHLLIDSDVGLAQGREVHGQPKKLGTTRLRTRGDLVVGTVKRNGIRLLRATTPFHHEQSDIQGLVDRFDFRTNINLKVIRNIDGTPGLCQITARRLSDVRVRSCWRGPATLELARNAQVPLHQLPVLEELEAYHWSADFSLVGGHVVVDLLRDEDR
jgi:acetoacetate decarboxylase